MKMMKKKILLVFCVLIVVVQLCGCGSSEQDAADYVDAYLKAILYEDYEQFARILKIPEEKTRIQMEKARNRTIKKAFVQLESFKEYDDIDETDYEEVRKAFQIVYSNARFEVKEARKSKKGYIVLVEAYPMDVMAKFHQGFETRFLEEFKYGTKKITGKEAVKAMMEYMEECCTDILYGDPVEIELKVKTRFGSITDVDVDDANKLLQLFFPTY